MMPALILLSTVRDSEMRMFLLGLLFIFCGTANAGKYLQPAYITNTYFCNTTVDVGGFAQPDSVFNILSANEPGALGTFVMNLLLDKGRHRVEVDILDVSGKKIDSLNFDAVEATEDDWTYTVTGRFGGSFEAGGIFFKVFDRHNRKRRVHIGTFRLLTE